MCRQAETAAGSYLEDSERRKADREELRFVSAHRVQDSEGQRVTLLIHCWGLG